MIRIPAKHRHPRKRNKEDDATHHDAKVLQNGILPENRKRKNNRLCLLAMLVSVCVVLRQLVSCCVISCRSCFVPSRVGWCFSRRVVSWWVVAERDRVSISVALRFYIDFDLTWEGE